MPIDLSSKIPRPGPINFIVLLACWKFYIHIEYSPDEKCSAHSFFSTLMKYFPRHCRSSSVFWIDTKYFHINRATKVMIPGKISQILSLLNKYTASNLRKEKRQLILYWITFFFLICKKTVHCH